ncbi:hypothetical protein X975_03253, partial [Stegodyphus mimosarum]
MKSAVSRGYGVLSCISEGIKNDIINIVAHVAPWHGTILVRIGVVVFTLMPFALFPWMYEKSLLYMILLASVREGPSSVVLIQVVAGYCLSSYP